MWLAWIGLAAPYGRYYYTVLFLPAWMAMAMAGAAAGGRTSRRWLVWFGRLGPLLAFVTKTHGVYPVLAVSTFAALLCMLAPETDRATTRILLPSDNPSRSRL